MRFDAYTATTTEATVSDVMSASAGVFSLFTDMKLRQGKGFHQFGERLAIMEEGHEVMAVQWGGNHGDRIMVEVKGERTPAAVEAFRAAFPHRVTQWMLALILMLLRGAGFYRGMHGYQAITQAQG